MNRKQETIVATAITLLYFIVLAIMHFVFVMG